MIRLQEQQCYEVEINEFGDTIAFEMGDAEYPNKIKEMLDKLADITKKADALDDIKDVDEQLNRVETLQKEACGVVDGFFGDGTCRNFTKTKSNPEGYNTPTIDVVLDFCEQMSDEFCEISGVKLKKIERRYANRAERRRRR